MLDFSRIEHDGVAVVHCPTEKDANVFLCELKKKYPTKQFFAGGNNWGFYKTSTCYWPNFGSKASGIQYGSLEYAVEHGYHVVAFNSLIAVPDLPIGEYEVDIKSLFGME